jgi:hypothetical protein
VLIAEVVTILARPSMTISPADSRQRSRETPATIVEAEARLVAAHGLFTLSHLLVQLGLPGRFGAASARMGRLGLVGFLAAFTGTMLIAVSRKRRVLGPGAGHRVAADDRRHQPLPARGSPQGVTFGGFVVGFVMFGVANGQDGELPPPLRSARGRGCPLPAGWLRPGPSSPHRRCGPLPSSAAQPLASALPGLAPGCGSIRRPDRDHRRRQRRHLDRCRSGGSVAVVALPPGVPPAGGWQEPPRQVQDSKDGEDGSDHRSRGAR